MSIIFPENTELQGKKRMIIQIIMTESTSYLDMNKKKKKKNLCHPNKTIQLSFVFVEISSRTRSLFFFENPTGSQPQNINYSPINFSPTPLDPKKIFPCFSPKQFFSTPTGIRTHTFMVLTARAFSARPIPPRRRRRRRRRRRPSLLLPCDPRF